MYFIISNLRHWEKSGWRHWLSAMRCGELWPDMFEPCCHPNNCIPRRGERGVWKANIFIWSSPFRARKRRCCISNEMEERRNLPDLGGWVGGTSQSTGKLKGGWRGRKNGELCSVQCSPPNSCYILYQLCACVSVPLIPIAAVLWTDRKMWRSCLCSCS